MVHTKCSVILDLTCATGTPLIQREDNYKYLGILQCDMILLKEVKDAVNKEYPARLQEILKASVSYKSTIATISKYTMTVLWYGFGILH